MEDLKQYEELRSEFVRDFHTSEDVNYYIISKKWLDQWLESVGQGVLPLKMEPIIEDLLLEKTNHILKYDPVESHMWNRPLKEGVQEGHDFEIVNSAIWNFFTKHHQYNLTTIERDSFVQNGKKTVNLNLQRIRMASVFPSSIHKFRGGKTSTLIKGDQHVSRNYQVQDFLELLEKTLQTVNGYNFLKKNAVRLYRCPAEWSYLDLEKHIGNEMKDLSYQDDLMFELKEAEYLDPLKYRTMDDCCIEPEQIVIMDCKESQKNWCVKNASFAMEGKCEGCYNYKILQHPCECKRVSYCSEDCKKRDESYHMPRCERTDSDEESMDKLVHNENSAEGRCGLRNLSNTCFMNSGIQCLSNTAELCEYFLSNTFKQDINRENPLGTKGELCMKFNNLLRRMWYGDKKQVAPFSLKRAIGNFQTQFQGYQQHDSQELINYLLDGLNEDLNRIKKKPYIELRNAEGRSDFDVASEIWDVFTRRNDSVVVENMYGLYKSKLNCPKCNKISITFDPFLMVNVSIPQSGQRKLQLNLVTTDVLWQVKTMEYGFNKNNKSEEMTVGKMLESADVREWIGALKDDLVLSCSSTYNQEEIDFNEKLTSLKKKLKYKKFYIRVKHQQEQQIVVDDKVNVLIHEGYKQYTSYQWKRDLTPPLNFHFSRHSTTIDIHKLCFNIHIGILRTFEGLESLEQEITTKGWETYYQESIYDKVYNLEFKTNQNFQQNCSYCSSQQCSDCLIPFNADNTIQSYLVIDPKLEIEIFIVWKRGYSLTSKVEDLYDDWFKKQDINKIQYEVEIELEDDARIAQSQTDNNNTTTTTIVNNNTSPELTLTECLQFSTQPEQLGEDNTWYCSVCQDHVQAFKSMEIYKVPKILMFHLKRFKSSNKYFKSKLETLIQFPIQGLDMREFALNHNLPQQFHLEDPNNSSNYNQITQLIASNTPVLYDIYAISNHYGGLGGGHYTAFAKNKYDNQWYHFDDSSVSLVPDPTSIITPAAYVLFYRRRE